MIGWLGRFGWLLTLILAVIAAVGIGTVGPVSRLALALLPLVVLLAWAGSDPNPLLALLAFVAGAVIDLAGQGPLGHWALAYLLGLGVLRWAIGREAPPNALEPGYRTARRGAALVGLAVTVATACGLEWAWTGGRTDPSSFVWAVTIAGLLLAGLGRLTQMDAPPRRRRWNTAEPRT